MRKAFFSMCTLAVFLCVLLSACSTASAANDDSSSSTEPGVLTILDDFKAGLVNPFGKNRFATVSGAGYGLNGGLFIVDRDTKVIYLFFKSGYGGGLTPLIDSDGNPVLYEGE